MTLDREQLKRFLPLALLAALALWLGLRSKGNQTASNSQSAGYPALTGFRNLNGDLSVDSTTSGNPTAPGYTPNVIVNPSGAPICPVGTSWNGSQCVSTQSQTAQYCPPGWTWDPANVRCTQNPSGNSQNNPTSGVNCPAGQVWNPGIGACVPAGRTEPGGSPAPSPAPSPSPAPTPQPGPAAGWFTVRQQTNVCNPGSNKSSGTVWQTPGGGQCYWCGGSCPSPDPNVDQTGYVSNACSNVCGYG